MSKFFVILILSLLPVNAFAATFFFDPPGKNVVDGEQFNIEFKVKVDNESINAIEGGLQFPKKLLKIIRIDITDSIISAWIEEPKIEGDKIIFSGVIPGGFDGVRKPFENGRYPGTLFKIIYEPKKSGSGAVVIENILVLKNDGVGSETESSTIPFAVNILPSTDNTNSDLYKIITIVIMIVVLGIIFIKIRHE